MSVSRREVLVGASLLALSAVAPLRGYAQSSGAALPVPPVLDATENGAIELTAVAGTTAFVPGAPSPTLGFGQAYLGPVVRLRSGSTVSAAVSNDTDRDVSVHWHGLLVAGDADGGPHQPIAPGATWRPTLTVDQPAATLWYHTHIHESTADGVYAGLAGVLIVDDGLDAERGLPTAFGRDDLVLVIQDKRFDAAGRAVYEPTLADALHGFLGDTILVNGAIGATAAVPAGIVRLRLLNACNARNFTLAFADGRAFHVIAGDQGYLPAPVAAEAVKIAPGERVEILVDFAAGDAVLMSAPHDEGVGAAGMAHAMGGMPMQEDPMAGPFPVLAFAVDAAAPVAIRSVPDKLLGAEPLAAPGEPSVTRDIVLNDMGMLVAPVEPGGHHMGAMAGMNMAPPAVEDSVAAVRFGINGQPFSMERIDHETALGSVERWIVGGEMMGHPFHVHGARFKVLTVAGEPPRPEAGGWKDTVFVTGRVELLVHFRHPAAAAAPFMFHCHVLEHEDRGMMGQFTVA